MSSGKGRVISGHYTGNNNAAVREFKYGFKPKKVLVESVVGTVNRNEAMPAPLKKLDSAVPAFIADAALELKDFGFQIATTDTSLNGAATEYYYEVWE